MFFLCIKIVITIRSEADFVDPSGKNKTKFEHFAKTSAPLILRRRVRLQVLLQRKKLIQKSKSNFPKFPPYNQHVFQKETKKPKITRLELHKKQAWVWVAKFYRPSFFFEPCCARHYDSGSH